MDTDLGNAPAVFFASKNVGLRRRRGYNLFRKRHKKKSDGGGGTFEERLGMISKIKTKEKDFVKEDGMIDDLISKLGNKKKTKVSSR